MYLCVVCVCGLLPPQSNTEARPLKPVAAVFLFSEEKKDEYQKKYPKLSNSELRKLLVKEFNVLSDKEKVNVSLGFLT